MTEQERIQSLLLGFQLLFKGFKPCPLLDAPISAEFEAKIESFNKRKGWSVKKQRDYAYSRLADWLLGDYAKRQGFEVDLTDVPGNDFAVILPGLGLAPERIRFETKSQPARMQRQLTFKCPYSELHSGGHWRDYDLLCAWQLTSDGLFVPWALVANYVLSKEAWDELWVCNRNENGYIMPDDRAGKHLKLANLPPEDYALL